MEYSTYQTIRGYCWQDLAQYLDKHDSNAVLALKVGIGNGTAEMAHEKDAAMLLYECKDLTPRERAAAHLLAVVSSHRAITWHRETKPPYGCVQAEPLEQLQAKALHEQTEKAVAEYVVHIPEREAAVLLAAVTGTQIAAHVSTHSAPIKTRTNSLDAPIKKAVELAGSTDTAAVFLQLKELALGEIRPFTGAIDDGSLCYTDDDDQPALLTKAQLGKRLKKHINASKRT